jgi:hypothetical protein
MLSISRISGRVDRFFCAILHGWMILLILFATSAAHPPGSCPGNHTILDSNGECACEGGYPFGDPDSDLGCFNCSKTCPPNSICIRMEICECRPGFSDAGAGKCIPFFPLPVLITPSSGSCKGGYTVNVTLESETSSKTVFCRFGHVIVVGVLKDGSTIECIAPAGPIGGVELRVSSNREDWNLPGIGFQYVLDKFDRTGTYLLHGIATLAIMFVIYITIIALRNPTRDLLDEELQPLKQGIPRAIDHHADLSMQGFYPL